VNFSIQHLCRALFFCLIVFALSGAVRSQTPASDPPRPEVASNTSVASPIENGGTAIPLQDGGLATVSPVIGFNFSTDFAAEHSSLTGWDDILTPILSYRFNRHFAVDASVPWYLQVHNFVPTKDAKGNIVYPLRETNNVLGDMELGGHIEADRGRFSYSLSPTVGLATGDSQFGLSADQPTYNITNHFEYNLGRFTPEIDLGEGDSSALANSTIIKKSYIAVGPLANFEGGFSTYLFWGWSLDTQAYENLPIGNQDVYGTVTKKGKNGKSRTVQVLEGTGVAEDNGVTAELDIPIGMHLTLGGDYQRSLIQGTDIADITLTYILRAPKISFHHPQ
jgi:hypothetical protein